MEFARKRDRDMAQKYREQLAAWYGKEAAGKFQYAEAFEICEYGRQPTKDDLRKLYDDAHVWVYSDLTLQYPPRRVDFE